MSRIKYGWLAKQAKKFRINRIPSVRGLKFNVNLSLTLLLMI